MKRKPITIFLYVSFALFFMSATPMLLAATGSDNSTTALSVNQEDERFDQTISGKVFRNEYGVPFKGVSVIFAPNGGTVITNDTGYYSITVPRNWSGTVTPLYCEDFETFAPAQRTYTNITTNYTNQNFTHSFTEEFTVSGTFTYADGTPLANRTIDLGEAKQVTTNEFGEYSIIKKPCWTNSIKPTLSFHYFIPDEIPFTSLNTNQENVDFQGVDYFMPIPPGFEFYNTANPCMISIEVSAQPNVCGEVIQPGDYIGVFFIDDYGQEVCGGHGIWSNHSNCFIAAMGDDNWTPEKDGFAWGETMRWKIYSYATGKTSPATPTFKTGDGLQTNNKWYPIGLYITKQLQGKVDNQILIPQGWSGLSSYTVPKSTIITNVMNPILSNLVILQDMTKMYYPGAGINTMLSWTPTKGYKIKVSQDVYLPMLGCPLANPTVNLTAGWNIVPVLSSCNVLLTEVFSPVMNNLTVVKEVAGTRVYWPAAGVQTLQVLEPGKAYFVMMTSAGSITYSDCDNYKQSAVVQQHYVANDYENTPWENPMHTATTHTIAIGTEAMESLPAESIIGVFAADGTCAGLANIGNKQQTVALTIFGDDPSSAEVEGLDIDENLEFKLFDITTGNTSNLQVEYDQEMPCADGYFTDNGLSMLKSMKMSATGVSGYDQQQVQIHPNPSTGIVNFRGNSDRYQVQVISVQGEIKTEQTIYGNAQLDLSQLPRGIYIVKIKDEKTSYIKKLVLK
ncbi:MAG: T9SS type A sorting domain-containing protein [Clostridia bacterium]|nr:T9SS type A sorting domain-containing protein [Clostridia bacterium]